MPTRRERKLKAYRDEFRLSEYKRMMQGWRKIVYCHHLTICPGNFKVCLDCGMCLKLVDGSETPAGELVRLRSEVNRG